ncbi:helix-turn-helix domain-containing protein [Aeoliella sp.]|uniref:AraC family transcriptional regulator n=1 Tax=Aeoliella sp. TaxID=2795800 RepID=UPI003CCBDEB3
MLSKFLDQLQQPLTGEELFDQLSDVVYFIKNQQCEYVLVNRTLAERCGQRDKRSLIGRRASEVLPPPIGQSFEDQDQAVLKTGQPIVSHLELHCVPSRDLGWCLTTKLPLRGKSGKTIGLWGVSQDLRLPDSTTSEFRSIAEVLGTAEKSVDDLPTAAQLANMAGMSRYQFDRRMRAVFGVSTRQWLVKLRIGTAEQMLRSSTKPISEIALAAGYADQSAFTRQFTRTTGLSPRDFRRAVSGG